MASESFERGAYPEDLDQLMPGSFPVGPSASAPPLSGHRTLAASVHARRAEYTRPRQIRIKVGTWNVAALKGTEADIEGWFVGGKGVTEAFAGLGVSRSGGPEDKESPQDQERRRSVGSPTIPLNDQAAVPAGEEIGLYVLGLQEVVDVTSPTEALRPYTDPAAANRFKTAVQETLPEYKLVAEQQLVGLLLLVYASPAVASEVKAVSTTSVGTGLMGYMGNKGAVTARIVLGETTRLVFINSHLAAGADKASVERRNWDANQIITRTRFDPIVDGAGVAQQKGEGIGDEDFAFWFGDLNYRLEGMPGDDVRHLLSLHLRNEYGAGAKTIRSSDESSEANSSIRHSLDNEDDDHVPSELDPASLQTTLSSLLPHDELHQQQRAKKAFHDGWKEGPILFLPTYKYDVGSLSTFDSSEKRRCPSWCDRIIYRTRKDKMEYDDKVREQEEAKKKTEDMKARGLESSGTDDDLLYDYNPEVDGDADEYDEYDEYADLEPAVVETKEGFEDELTLEYYTAHQRVISSDHKPLDATFRLKYDAVVPELKARIHQEVAKELDRAENEGRPTITLIVERHNGATSIESKEGGGQAFEGVDFGNIRYAQSKRRSVTIANTGQVPSTISFVDRPVEKKQFEGPAPPWISIKFDRDPDKKDPKQQQPSPDRYTLEPGDACNVEILLRVDVMELVRSLNAKETLLDDILVLRVEDGRDHFLPVRGRWLQSSFGRSIDKLIRIPEGGIRKLQGQKPSGGSDSPVVSADQGVKWSAPRELFRLTESIEDHVERVLAEWEMTHSDDEIPPWKSNAGWPFAEESWVFVDQDARDAAKIDVYEALDCDQPFDKAFPPELPRIHRLELLAETLLLFLNSLEDGVITLNLWKTIEEAMIAREKHKHTAALDDERTFLLELLVQAPNHNVSFVLLTSMIQRIALEIGNVVRETSKDPAALTTPTKKRESMDLPATPKSAGAVRRKTLSLSQIPEIARRQLVDRSLSAIFAPALIKVEDLGKGKDRERRLERMTRVVEVFVREM